MKRLSPGIRFLLGFVTFLLCVVLFVTTLAGILVSNVVRILSSQENTERLLRQVIFVDMRHPSSPRASSVNNNALSLRSGPEGGKPLPLNDTPITFYAQAPVRLSEEQQTAASMVEWIYEELSKDFTDELNIDLSSVKEFVERSTLDDFLVEKVAGLLHDVYTGESTVSIPAEEIRAKVEENASLIEEYFKVTVDTEVIANITETIEKNEYVERIEEEGIINILARPEDGSDAAGSQSAASKVQDTVAFVRKLLSLQTLLIFGGACLLLIGLILLVNMKQIWVGMNKAGVTMMAAALPFVVLTIVVCSLPAGWAKTFGLPSILEVLIREILSINSVICFGVFAFGLALLVGGIVTYCIVRGKRKKDAVTATIGDALIAEAPLPVVEFPVEEQIPAVEEAAVEEEIPTTEETPDEETAEETTDEVTQEEASEEAPVEETTKTV